MNINENFFDRVYSVTKQIPHGRVTTFGTIARMIGSPQAARMVGWALNKCESHHEFVPAHRVVNRNGLLTGKHHFGGESIMRQLLESEGVVIKDNKVQNFEKIFWQPEEFDE